MMPSLRWSGNSITTGSKFGQNTDLSHLQPLLFDFEGASMLAVFTASDLVSDLADQAAYLVAIPGSEIVDILPPGTGLAVNPRNDLGFMLPPDAVAALRDALSGR